MSEIPGEIAYGGARAPSLPASTRPVWGRRLLTIPTTFAAAFLAVVLAPVFLPLALLIDVLALGRLSATRTSLFFVVFLWAEVVGLAVAAWVLVAHRSHPDFVEANHRLQRRWATFLFRAARRLFDVRVTLEGAEELEREGGCLFFVRHASTLDTLLPFVADDQRRFRYVLKHELLVDPCLDVVGNRLPNCFVERGSDRKEREIHRVVRLSDGVGEDEAVVIFPEGTRYTPGKRAHLVERMRQKGERAADLAAELQHTLSPLRAGALALGTSARDLDLVVVAHRGIEAAGSLRDLITGGLTHKNLRIRVWRTPAADVPRDDDAFRAFLADRWRAVDAFVGG